MSCCGQTNYKQNFAQIIDHWLDQDVKAVVDKAIKSGLVVRIISIDDKVFHTGSGCCKQKAAENSNRLNLRVKNNKVIQAYLG